MNATSSVHNNNNNNNNNTQTSTSELLIDLEHPTTTTTTNNNNNNNNSVHSNNIFIDNTQNIENLDNNSNNNINSIQSNVILSINLTSTAITKSSTSNSATTTVSPSKLNKYLTSNSRTHSSASIPTNNTNSSIDISLLEVFDTKIIKTKPIFVPSFSGQYCAILWQESHLYMIIRLTLNSNSPTDNSNDIQTKLVQLHLNNNNDNTINSNENNESSSNSTIESMEIVKRGYCLSFAWVDNNNTTSNNNNTTTNDNNNQIQYESYALLERGKRKVNIIKSKSILSLSFRSSGSITEEEGEFLPPCISMHQLPLIATLSSNNANTGTTTTVNTTKTNIKIAPSATNNSSNTISSIPITLNTMNGNSDIHQPCALYSGPLICITSLRPAYIKQKTTSKTTINNNNLTSASIHSTSSTDNDSKSQTNTSTNNTTTNNNSMSPSHLKASSNNTLKANTIANIISSQTAANRIIEESVGNDSVALQDLYVSRFYRLTKQLKKTFPTTNVNSNTTTNNTTKLNKNDTSTIIASSNTEEWETVLLPVGSYMPAVSNVTWECNSPLVAVLIQTHINILQLQTTVTSANTTEIGTIPSQIDKKTTKSKLNTQTDNANNNNSHSHSNSNSNSNSSDSIKVELISMTTINMASNIFMTPQCMLWQSGILYVNTPLSVYMVATHTTTASNSNNNSNNIADIGVDVAILAVKDYVSIFIITILHMFILFQDLVILNHDRLFYCLSIY